jgi:Tol biopolymer transport system component
MLPGAHCTGTHQECRNRSAPAKRGRPRGVVKHTLAGLDWTLPRSSKPDSSAGRSVGRAAALCAALVVALAATSAVAATDGEHASNISSSQAAATSSTRQARNGKIARVCAIYGYPGAKICLNDPSGANPEWFPKDRRPLHLSGIDWSPDGRSLAVTFTGPPDCSCVYILRRNGRLTTVSPELGGSADGPQWSPDGRKILFRDVVAGDAADTTDIFVINANRSGLRNLTRGAAGSINSNGRWSRDGRRIAYEGSCDPRLTEQGLFSLCVMNADGSQKRALTPSARFRASDWSPNGAKLLGTGSVLGRRGIAFFNLRTRRVTFLTRGRTDNSPQYSPDGRWILFSSNGYLRIMRADGSEPRPITVGRNRQLGASIFDWQPSPR